MYIYTEEPPLTLYSEFDHRQSYPDDMRTVRQIEILPSSEAYAPDNGLFDTDMVIEGFGQTLQKALAQGYTGLRVAAEMDWVLSSYVPTDKFREYEMKLNDFFPEKKLTGVCQFNSDKFPVDFLLDMILTHPYIFIQGKLYMNKYFYSNPKYSNSTTKKIAVEDYPLIISTILEDEPLVVPAE